MTKTKPFSQVRLGSINAAIWKNETKNGTRFNVTFERLYHDGKEWKSSDSFGRDDLLALAKVADFTHTRIFELQDEERTEPEEKQDK